MPGPPPSADPANPTRRSILHWLVTDIPAGGDVSEGNVVRHPPARAAACCHPACRQRRGLAWPPRTTRWFASCPFGTDGSETTSSLAPVANPAPPAAPGCPAGQRLARPQPAQRHPPLRLPAVRSAHRGQPAGGGRATPHAPGGRGACCEEDNSRVAGIAFKPARRGVLSAPAPTSMQSPRAHALALARLWPHAKLVHFRDLPATAGAHPREHRQLLCPRLLRRVRAGRAHRRHLLHLRQAG